MREHKELKELVDLLDANKDNLGNFTLGIYEGKNEEGNLDVTVMVADSDGYPLGVVDIFEELAEADAKAKCALVATIFEESEYKAFYDTNVVFDYKG